MLPCLSSWSFTSFSAQIQKHLGQIHLRPTRPCHLALCCSVSKSSCLSSVTHCTKGFNANCDPPNKKWLFRQSRAGCKIHRSIPKYSTREGKERIKLHRLDNRTLIRSGEARLVGWSRQMLYSGFNILPRSIIRSANSIDRSDNLDVIPLKPRHAPAVSISE